MSRPGFLLAAVLIGLVGPVPAVAQSISGTATAVDGDTLSLTGVRVRLRGIDAPELEQTCDRGGTVWRCGEEAKAAPAQLIQGAQLSCQSTETDNYGRMVAVCRGQAIDLGEEIVRLGLATAYTEYSGAYVQTEARAKELKLGIWNSTFEAPASWRSAHHEEQPKAKGVTLFFGSEKPQINRDNRGRCSIKGNHSRKGEWIYHLPGQAYYDQTRPEAVFCSEEAAQRAGYRPSKV